MKRVVVISSVVFGFLGCGTEQSTTTPRTFTPKPRVVTNNTPASCEDLIEKTDFDADGLTDAVELYGYEIKLHGQTVTVYSNPLLADTDGDGRKDEDELENTKYNNVDAVASSAVVMHPARKDYFIKVFASGGKNSVERSSTTKIGWNGYSVLKFNAGAIFRIYDTQISQYNAGQGGSYIYGVTGSATPLTDCTDTVCMNSVKRGALIGKFANSDNPATTGGTAIKIGTLADGANPKEWTNSAVPVSSGSPYLLLRANDLDGNELDNNTGFVSVVVRIDSDSTDSLNQYPQDDPTGTNRETEMLDKLCDNEESD